MKGMQKLQGLTQSVGALSSYRPLKPLVLLPLILAMGGLVFADDSTQTDRPAFPADAMWSKEPTELKGIDFTASIEQAKAKNKFSGCSKDPKDHEFEACLMMPAEVRKGLDIRFSCHYRNGKLERILTRFPVADYEELRDLFIAEYGRPSIQTQGSIQNKMGAKFDQERTTWIGKVITIQIDRYSDYLEEGIATYVFTDTVKANPQEEEAKRERLFQ
jgi:hypothetical protein